MNRPRVILWDDLPQSPLPERAAPADAPVEQGLQPCDVVSESNIWLTNAAMERESKLRETS